MPKKPNTKIKYNRLKIILVSILGCIVLLLLFDLSPFGGNIRFYSKWQQCGSEPVVVGGPGHSIIETTVPYYYDPPTFSLSRSYFRTFCSPLEAEKYGYSASSTEYKAPELKKHYGDKYCIGPHDPIPETAVTFPHC